MLNTQTQFSLWKAIWISIFLFVFVLNSEAKDDGLARTPPMGWNSWNAFEAKID